MSQKLLDYNKRGALSHLLAIEEHLQGGGNPAWCAQKHALLCCDHHLAEAVNHASRFDPAQAARCARLKAKAEAVLRPGRLGFTPRLAAVASLRNEARQVFGDPTMADGCSVCAQDGVNGMSYLGYTPERVPEVYDSRQRLAVGAPMVEGLGKTILTVGGVLLALKLLRVW